ncbi:MAG: hypothetical protein R6V50_03260, partial [Thermoplasmatota archaeon]
MNKLYRTLVLITFLVLISSNGIGFVQRTQNEMSGFFDKLDAGFSYEQDGPTIAKLQWVSPDNTLPGTYQRYIESNPLSPAFFSTPNPTYAPGIFGDDI